MIRRRTRGGVKGEESYAVNSVKEDIRRPCVDQLEGPSLPSAVRAELSYSVNRVQYLPVFPRGGIIRICS